MKVSTSELPPRQLALDIEVEQERLDRAMEQAYQRIARSVNVPGFRKGKAPRTMIERMVGRQSIVEDAVEHLIPDVVNEAIEQEKVEAYGRPRVDSIEFDPLRVRATVPLEPRVDLGDYGKTLRIDADDATVTDADVDEVLNRLRESYASWVPVERAVERGDRVGIDVHGEVQADGEDASGARVLMDSKDAEYVADPEGPQPAPGFAEQLIGMTAGAEKTFTLALPEDYREEALAGKPVVFAVKLHWVKAKELPEVDDALASQLGEYETMAAVRDAIRGQLTEREEQRVREAQQSAALDKLVEISTVEVAPQVVDHQAEHMLESFAQQMERQGLKMEQYLRFAGKTADELRGDLHEEAEKRVKRSLALDAFLGAEKIDVQPEELELAVAEVIGEGEGARTAGLDDEQKGRIEAALRERKALTRLVEIATSGGAPKGRKKAAAAASQTASDAGAGEKLSGDGEPADTQPAKAKRRPAAKAAQESANA